MAVNEYGALLDRNGYAPSILQHSAKCLICGREDGLQRHEPWGNANRNKSKNLGLWVLLCYVCHDGVTNRRRTPENDYAMWELDLRKIAEASARADYGWTKQEFIRRFGKSLSDR